jgi:hypothetical protein
MVNFTENRIPVFRNNRISLCRRSVAAIALVTFLFALAGCGGVPGNAPTMLATARAIPPASFGFDIHDALTDWPPQPFGLWRLWDANVDWARVEPAPGVFDFSLLDQYVSLAAAHGVQIIYVLGNTPTWASQDPTVVGNEHIPGASAPPSNVQDWQTFVQAVATRYRGRILAYEVWNEANLSSYWTGSLGDMLQLTQIAFQTIKQIDPAAAVLAPSVVGGGGLSYTNDFLSQGGDHFTDAIPYHLYDTSLLPEEALPYFERVVSLAQQWSKPLWDTETGFGPWGTFSSEQDAAAFVARTLILQSALGVTHIVWYAWDDRGPWVHLFMTESDLRTPTLAATAFAQVEHWLEGSTISCSSQNDGSWQCPLTQNGQQKFIVWNPTATTGFSIPSGWRVSHVRDLQGNMQPIADGQIEIGSSPVLLEP